MMPQEGGTQSPGGKGAQEVGETDRARQRRKRETGGLERVLLWRGATNRRKGRAPVPATRKHPGPVAHAVGGA